MKTLSILFVGISIISQIGNAQIKDSKILSLENVNVIVLESKDQSSIQHSSRDQVRINSYLFKKGKILGFKSPSERPKFEIECNISNDTLYLSSPDKYSPLVVGINTYAERIETNFEIPAKIKVIVKNANELVINDLFKSIQVNHSDKIIYNNLQKSEIARMICIANESQIINGGSRRL